MSVKAEKKVEYRVKVRVGRVKVWVGRQLQTNKILF